MEVVGVAPASRRWLGAVVADQAEAVAVCVQVR